MSESKDVIVKDAIIDEEPREISVPSIASNSGEYDIQISTAHRFPRSISKFKNDALAMATDNESVAESCFYNIPRGGKEIEGPSVRLAEICASAFGNLRFGARIIEETDKFIVAQGTAFDLEKNIATTIEVRRRITDKYGKKYNDDLIAVTANAASSIALRNAIFKIIPRSFIETIYEAAKKVAVGDASTLNSRRTIALEYYAKLGVSKEQILTNLGKVGIEDIDLKDMEKLTGLKTALKDGEVKLDDVFPTTSKDTSKAAGILSKIRESKITELKLENVADGAK